MRARHHCFLLFSYPPVPQNAACFSYFDRARWRKIRRPQTAGIPADPVEEGDGWQSAPAPLGPQRQARAIINTQSRRRLRIRRADFALHNRSVPVGGNTASRSSVKATAAPRRS